MPCNWLSFPEYTASNKQSLPTEMKPINVKDKYRLVSRQRDTDIETKQSMYMNWSRINSLASEGQHRGFFEATRDYVYKSTNFA